MPLLETPGSDTKKKSFQATERDAERGRQARQRYRIEIGSVAFERLTFVDELGVDLAMTRH